MEQLVQALGPAFATGFAVQRLLEILDPIIPTRLAPSRKKSILGLVSLGFGFAAAGSLSGARVLHLLGINGELIKYLDFLVTALIISAGTEGFNSIMKFLSYKKEETKAAAVTEKVAAARSLSAGGTRGLENLNLVPENLGRSFDNSTTLEDALEESLQGEIKNRWLSKFVASTWKQQPFSDYTQDPDDPKVVVLQATRSVAISSGLSLPDKNIKRMQNEVGLATTGNQALASMRKALV